jgi:L-cysteine S-thiosulfotransferase
MRRLLNSAVGWALVVALMLAGAATAADDTLSPALRALQADDSQNPAMLWVQDGLARWQQAAGPNARSCQGCHGAIDGATMKSAALRHPAWDRQRGGAITLSQRIRQCRSQHQRLPSAGPEDDAVLALEAALAHQSRSRPQPVPDDARLQPLIDEGRAWWQRRIGQIDLACMHCHDQRAGQRLAGSPIPAGHPLGYPVYRFEWQTLGSLQRRLRGCMVGVRAQPFAPDAAEWTAIEVFLKARAHGRIEHTPGVRP